ncbi:MAG: DNA-3-methyladenine glycosylase [Candidatus Aegiribacteria sp.]|nr:DNA-3-methyladenine glycosylase [Candidatus Aegiribacteria sp.]
MLPPEEFFLKDAVTLAPALLGCLLRRDTPDGLITGIIVETESYTEDDPASHAFGGRTDRNWPMFEQGGMAYVYLIYGIHNCFNVTSGMESSGEAVLVRALQPVEGIGLMRRNRMVSGMTDLCSGPGKLCQALSIDRNLSGVSLMNGDIQIRIPRSTVELNIAITKRIGITKAAELPRRFLIMNSKWASGRIDQSV